MASKSFLFTLLTRICWLSLLGLPLSGWGQGMGINTTTPDASAVLDLTATDKGVLIPRMTAVQRTAIAAPANGLLVYDTDWQLFYYNAGTSGAPNWIPITTSAATTLTRVKILPRDFMASGKSKSGSAQPKGEAYDNVNSNQGVVMADDNTDLVAFVEIPTGYKATHVRIYGNDTRRTYEVFESSIATGNVSSKGSANVGDEANITDVSSTSTNFLVIMIYFNDKEDDRAYGGYVTLAPI